jgi:hypothetical protein
VHDWQSSKQASGVASNVLRLCIGIVSKWMALTVGGSYISLVIPHFTHTVYSAFMIASQ